MIYLSVKEVSELSGISERHIRRLAANGTLNCVLSTNDNSQIKYEVPLNALTHQEQLKYYKQKQIDIPAELLPKQSVPRPHKNFDEFSAAQREEIAEWMRIINAWDEYCVESNLQKVAATEKFVQMQQTINPHLNISKGILYR